MKQIDELFQNACPDGLIKLKPEKLDTERIAGRTFEKLGLQRAEKNAPHKRRRGLKATCFSVSGAAACLVLLLCVNAAFPAFAESLPGIGGLFRTVNEHNRAHLYNAENVSRVEERMAPVSEVKTSTGEGDLNFNVQEAYYDGKYLYCAAVIETELDPNADKTDWRYKVFVNGKQLDFDYRSFTREWVKTGENTYANDEMSTLIPEEYRPKTPGDIRVKYEIEFTDLSRTKPSGDTHGQEVTEVIPETLASATAEFTAKYDPGETVEFQSGAEQNGVKLLSFSASPASTEVVLDVPRQLSGHAEYGYADIRLFRMNGRELALNSGFEEDSGLSEDYTRVGKTGESIPLSDTKVVVMLMHVGPEEPLGEGEVAAEFTIDLKEKTATPSELWKDSDGSLYWNREAEFHSERVFTSYRAPDSILQELENGYRVEFLSYMDGLPVPLLNLVTDQDYRALQVELLDENGAVWASASTQQTQALEGYFSPAERIMFQPFAAYDFSYYDSFRNQMEDKEEKVLQEYRSRFGEKRLSHITGGEIPREMDKDGLNAQTVFLEWGDHFPLAGERYTVRITDSSTGELVHQETVEMALPENLNLEEGQRVVKLRGSYNPYVILNEE